jgi:hypothetical protein
MRRVWIALVVVVIVFIALLLLRGGGGQPTRGGRQYTIDVTVTESSPCRATIASTQKIVAQDPGESVTLRIVNADPSKNCAGGSITVSRFRHKPFKGGFCWASGNADQEFRVAGATFSADPQNPKGRHKEHRYCYTAELHPRSGDPIDIDPETEIIWP